MVGVAGLDVLHQHVGHLDGRIEVAPVAGHLVEDDQFAGETGGLVGLQDAFAGHHVAVVDTGVPDGVVRKDGVGPGVRTAC